MGFYVITRITQSLELTMKGQDFSSYLILNLNLSYRVMKHYEPSYMQTPHQYYIIYTFLMKF